MNTSHRLALFATAFALATFIPTIGKACTVSTASGARFSSIAQAVAAVDHISDTLTIDGSSGACNENVFVDNTHLRLVITGTNGATINGAASGPTLDMRVKGVGVYNLTVTGGSAGIVVSRNTNAWIQNVTVQSTGGVGIAVSSMAYAIIVANTIRNNKSSGIVVSGLASAGIGTIMDDGAGVAPTFQGNVIESNGDWGIQLKGNATALIYANNIIGNAQDGIIVGMSSSAFTGGNLINSNGQYGIHVNTSSSVVIGMLPDVKTPYPDQTTMNNGTYGIECWTASSVLGHLGSANQLNGSLGQWNSVDNSCPDGNSLLQVP